ncbi:MAG: DUF4105 domain-containing protein [Gammaproteobacteria bacterium]|nr:DUF4105 domain-containing protein [Gammaproteobacteria bacterium]
MNKRIKSTAYLLSLILLPVSFSAQAEEPVTDSVVDELIESATRMQLADDPGWLNLLHYKSHVFSGVYSQADDGAFFLADEGHVNAQAELGATLKALLSNKDSQCKFPARLHWLDLKLNFRHQLPVVECSEFKQWKNRLAVSGVSLVFPSMYLNNPASMFGHTFLRLDQKNNPTLLNYTLSYAARSDPDDTAIEYVYKGLAGGYAGVFAVQPYFETVQSYGDIEHRDIWEYSLNLSQSEVDQLIRHVWEIRNTQFDYYFLRENCSYRLLALLDVARPGINMTQKKHFPVYAAPVDTVRSVMNAGFVKQKKYRPAISSRIDQMYQQLSSTAREKVFYIIDNQDDLSLNNFSLLEQAQILEMAEEISEFNKQNINNLFLSQRSRLDIKDQPTFLFEKLSADQGHATARWHIAYGEENQQHFVELGIRPVFHDLLDNPDGFVKGAAISVMDARLRWFEKQQDIQLEQLDLFSLFSLSPVKQWMTPFSARLDISVQQQIYSAVDDAMVMHLDSAMGLSADWGQSVFYLMADLSVEYSGWYEKNHKGYLGAEVGAVFQFDSGRMHIDVQLMNGVTGEEDSRDRYQWAYQFDLLKDQGIRFSYDLIRYDTLESKSLDIKYLYYF